jgi:hypothetical protein
MHDIEALDECMIQISSSQSKALHSIVDGKSVLVSGAAGTGDE